MRIKEATLEFFISIIISTLGVIVQINLFKLDNHSFNVSMKSFIIVFALINILLRSMPILTVSRQKTCDMTIKTSEPKYLSLIVLSMVLVLFALVFMFIPDTTLRTFLVIFSLSISFIVYTERKYKSGIYGNYMFYKSKIYDLSTLDEYEVIEDCITLNFGKKLSFLYVTKEIELESENEELSEFIRLIRNKKKYRELIWRKSY